MNNKFEILDNLSIITQPGVSVSQLMLNGISLGDDESLLSIEFVESQWQVDKMTKWVKSKIGGQYKIKNGKVVEISLMEELVESLRITSTKDIFQNFGPTKAIDKKYGQLLFHYEPRNIVVHWSETDKKLTRIFWGDVIPYPTLRRENLLEQYLDLRGFSPEPHSWSEKNFRNNPPRLYRYKQLDSLFQAFGIDLKYMQSFEEGEFIKARPVTDYTEWFSDIEAYGLQTGLERDRDFNRDTVNHDKLIRIFAYLFKYRMVLERTLQYNSGWLEAGATWARYMIDKTEGFLNEENRAYIKYLDNLLCFAIDPYQQQYKKYELIEKYGYPDVDLSDIDADYY
ncbi:hypothetical protein QNI19_26205 [Cytophagaceae bacterium DM2B3-1]|uniref:Uncharacterized protein n=1 Tax=Xanthocytophaga flava TaxID=3048013 RepID=A0ABT7CRS3_9BACT|nr:hypothetical protein [Xanthocytophaga flavus]MDJ1468675.1 hypothetical protein [Xanthocytophaga flavus]MDJ1496456.1 hypothetical protein [Xanthocytophaga flavus]